MTSRPYNLAANVSAGKIVVGDYTVTLKQTGETGGRLEVTRGNETQTLDIQGEDAPQEAVLFVKQTLTSSQQAQARANIGAAAIGEVTAPSGEILFADRSTGRLYILSVNDGALQMAEAEQTAVALSTPNDTITLTDNITGAEYMLYVTDGKLTMTEVDE